MHTISVTRAVNHLSCPEIHPRPPNAPMLIVHLGLGWSTATQLGLLSSQRPACAGERTATDQSQLGLLSSLL